MKLKTTIEKEKKKNQNMKLVMKMTIEMKKEMI